MSNNDYENETNEITEQNAPEKKKSKKDKKFNLGKELFEWFYTIAIAFVIVFAVKAFLFDIVKVDGESMYPTLHHGDRLVVQRLAYEPKQGDIIILDSAYKNREAYYDKIEETSGKTYSSIGRFFDYFKLDSSLKRRYYVKRIIALPGQTVDIRSGKVYVDGNELEEEYYDGETYITDVSVEYPLVVEEDHVFVMGDNRSNSSDSRTSSLGQVPYDAIMGEAVFRILPLGSFGTV